MPHIDISNKKLENERDIYDYIDRTINYDGNSKVIFLIGSAGVGKSTLMYKFSTIFTKNDIYYYSLKDLIINSRDKVNFYDMLNKALGLNSQSMNLALFLDGFDEIANLLDEEEFISDLTRYYDNNITIIFTTRPNYIFESLNGKDRYPFIELGYIEHFKQKQVSEWLDKYTKNNLAIKKDTLNAIRNIKPEDKMFEIISIPIILYITTSQNIYLSEVNSSGELYDKVFSNLTRDKSLYSKNKYTNIHYNIAKEIAFIMYTNNWMSISDVDIEKNLSIIFDKTFYSSVYMNKIIEGTHMSEFVHKSIQDFFASKWIWEHISNDDFKTESIYEILSQKVINTDIENYIYYHSGKSDVELLDHRFIYIINYFFAQNAFFRKNNDLEKYLKSAQIFLQNIFNIYYIITNKYFDINCLTLKRSAIKLFTFLSTSYMNMFISKVLISEESLYINNYVDLYSYNQNTFYNCTFKKSIVDSLEFDQTLIGTCKFENSYIKTVIFQNSTIVYTDLTSIFTKEISFINTKITRVNIRDIMILNIYDCPDIYSLSISCKYLCDSMINNSTLYKSKLFLKSKMCIKDSTISNSVFKETSFEHVFFYNCNLTNIIFDKCNFNDIIFNDNNIIKK